MTTQLLLNSLLSALAVVSGLSLLFGAILGYASVRFRVEGDPLVDQVDELLPQSQCGQCGYPGCRPYAEAVVQQGVSLNLCSPGGQSARMSIAGLLGIEPPSKETGDSSSRQVAFIDESDCFGCGKCIRACPVDAIIGASRQLHTILDNECTGCGLCVPTCDTDCIAMRPVTINTGNWRWKQPLGEATPIALNMPGIRLA